MKHIYQCIISLKLCWVMQYNLCVSYIYSAKISILGVESNFDGQLLLSLIDFISFNYFHDVLHLHFIKIRRLLTLLRKLLRWYHRHS